jgi:endonuclease YncB( thermonuclease family)
MSKKKYIYDADVVRIIDGDSIVLKADLGFDVWISKSFRLNGIDTPESRINLRKFPERKREKELGLKAKERLKVLCGKKVLIEVVDKGKYGRPLINIFTGETARDICKILIEEKLAIKYQGEKKTFVW